MSIRFPTTRGMLMIMRMYNLITFFTMCPFVSSQFETLPKIVSESVTLTCEPSLNVNDNDPISWYRKGRASFVNNDEDRISATCKRSFYKDRCSLTIDPLTTDDADVYVCEYYNGVYNLIGGVNLTVGYGQLPSDDSPICELYKGASDGGYIPANEQETFTIGDDIYVRCEAQDSSFTPSLSWTREREDIITDLTPYVKARSIYHLVSLTENDVSASFVCFMKHPAISETRNCSIIPLPALTTTPEPTTKPTIAIPAKIPAKYPSPSFHSTENANKDTNPSTKSNTSNTFQQSYTLPIIIAVILIIVATVVVILIIVLIKRRKKHGVIPSKLSYELTYERDRSITAEYEAVNSPDSIDLGRDLKDAKQYRQENLYATDQNSTATTSEDDASSLYAKPNKGPKLNRKMNKSSCQYENLPRQISFEEHDEGTERTDDGLMYAYLELSEFRDSDSARMTPINKDATVYADIKGSL